MQPHDPEHSANAAPLSEDPSRSPFPDPVSRSEHDAVSTNFDPETGRRTKRAVGAAGAFLLLCFVVVIAVRHFHAGTVAKAGEAAYSMPPPVTWSSRGRRPPARLWCFRGRPRRGTKRRFMHASTAMWRSGWWTSAITSTRASCSRPSKPPSSTPSCRPPGRSSRPRRRSSRRERPRSNSANPPTSVGAIRRKGSYRSRSARRRRRTTEVPRRGCMRPMRR